LRRWSAYARAAYEVYGCKTEGEVFAMKAPGINELVEFNESPDGSQAAILQIFKTRAR
jgi:hypothetical protein